jgi:sugar phosphate isomerase/epimerase
MKKVTRRSLLRSSAVAAGAGFITQAAPLTLLRAANAFAENQPKLQFPTAPRERLSIASWPFRAEIESPTNEYRDKSKPGMDLKDFAAKVRERFHVPGVEPLSTHFPSTDDRYLKTFREAIDNASVHVVDIPVDNEISFYDPDVAARKQAVQQCKHWVDVALVLGSPSLRTSIADAKNAKPNVDLTAESLRALVDYAASKNVVINLENDNPVSEDPTFLIAVLSEVNHPYLHALPDFCNSMANSNSEQFNDKTLTMLFPHAYNICHVKDSEVGDNNKVARVDLKHIFTILKASNYRGYCSMEWEGPEDPYVGTERLIAASLANL